MGKVIKFGQLSHRRTAPAWIVAAALCLSLTSGCTEADEPGDRPAAGATDRTRPNTAAPSPAESPNDGQVEAERVKDLVSEQLDVHLATYGEGTTSPCRPNAAELFTETCLDAARSIGSVARTALDEIDGDKGFGTLRRVSQATADASRGYTESGCSANPQEASVRQQCVSRGALLSQAPADLRDGLRLGLAGQ
ncbi:hypothetical protein ACFT9I_17615 [Streptomyces sp. NPDC057137]|uniref:hypothetical protein n=1 Tax=Streptomyces sp. NPDC057137 TaxID=3346030 RepID=UPI00363DA28E